MSNIVLEHITDEVKKAQYFALMVDESKDCSKTEQLSIVIRYYLDGNIYERFLGFEPANKLDASSLLICIKQKLANCGVDLNYCVAQTYDGAAVMSGSCTGVQALLSREVPQAIYTHCMNHKLNLVIVATCRGIKSATDFFMTLQGLYVFMSGSTVHQMFIDTQMKMKIGKVELKKLSDTRWACQYSSCLVVKRTIKAIIVILVKI